MSDFKDTLGPLNQLTESAKASMGEPPPPFPSLHPFFFSSSTLSSPSLSLVLSLTFSYRSSLSADTPRREEKFEASVDVFKAHSTQMARTAANLAKSGGITDKKVADDLITSSSKVLTSKYM